MYVCTQHGTNTIPNEKILLGSISSDCFWALGRFKERVERSDRRTPVCHTLRAKFPRFTLDWYLFHIVEQFVIIKSRLFKVVFGREFRTLDYFDHLKRNLHLFFSFLFLEIKTDMAM